MRKRSMRKLCVWVYESMTDEERQKRIDHFREVTKMVDEEEAIENVWTHEDMIAIADKILERIRRDEKL